MADDFDLPDELRDMATALGVDAPVEWLSFITSRPMPFDIKAAWASWLSWSAYEAKFTNRASLTFKTR